MDTRPVRVLSLFSGVSGLGCGVRIALPGSRHVLFVEREFEACEVLADVAGRQRTWKKLHPAGMTACGHTTNNRHLVLELCDQAEKVMDLRPLVVLVP